MSENYEYDAVIIGAGISGLVCGCYLARSGMKTLIVEKNAGPGGYCTSFKRGGFHFDACVHSLGSLRGDGNLKAILNELDLIERLGIGRYDPSDIIITPDYKISFWNDIDRTVHELQDIFPQEAGSIKEFFYFILNFNPLTSAGLLNKTFDELLKKYFKSGQLMAILALPVLGNAGLPASMISAFPAVMLYKEFVIDGGYYPDNGIQDLPDALTEKFRELGGAVFFKRVVCKAQVKEKNIEGVILESGEYIRARYVVSNMDGRNTFFQLLGEQFFNEADVRTINNLSPSLSAFSIYVGLDKPPETNKHVNLWYLPDYNIQRNYDLITSGRLDHEDTYYILFIHDNTVCLFVNAPFEDKDFWLEKKEAFTDSLINKARNKFPDIFGSIATRFAATPVTLYNHTFNYRGAAYGWAPLCSQYLFADMSKMSPFENLFLTGHWTSSAFGVSGVAFLGRNTAKSILNRYRN